MSVLRSRRGQRISACDFCWKRKIKCDGAKPKCFWCAHYENSCLYVRDGIRSPKLGPIDSLLIKKSPRNAGTSGMAAQEADNVALHLFRSLSRARVPSSVIQGWAQFKAGELVSIDGLCRDRFDQDGLSPPPTFSSARAYADVHQINAAILPDRGLIHKCARLYMKSIIRVTFPILEPSGFNETTRLAYEPAADHPSHVLSARACIVAFCMFAYLVPLGIQVCSERKFIYYSALLQRVLPTITETATVDGFQACIFLLLSQFFTGRMISASVTNSLAAQFVFHLDAHTEGPTRSFSRLQGNHLNGASICLRSLFWVCYTIDKELCLRTQQPPALSDNHCDLTLRTDYLARFLEDFADSLPFGEFHPSMMFPIDIKLSQIKSQAYDSLYSRAAFREGHTKLFTQIRKLDETLERWRMAVPQKSRPSLLFPSDTGIDARNVDIRTLILRLDYLHCMAVIHQASNRGLQIPINGHNTKATIASSIALAVEASRSSLRYLDNAHHILSKGSFWLVLFYPLTASVTILCNILDNPALPSTVHDYDLLKKVPRLMRNMSRHRFETEELLHKRQLDLFVQELIRAAECAIFGK